MTKYVGVKRISGISIDNEHDYDTSLQNDELY